MIAKMLVLGAAGAAGWISGNGGTAAGGIRSEDCICTPSIQITAGNPCNVTWKVIAGSYMAQECELITGVLCIDTLEQSCNVQVQFGFPAAQGQSVSDGAAFCVDILPGATGIAVTMAPPTPLGCLGSFGATLSLLDRPCNLGGAPTCTTYVGVVCDGCH